MEPHDTLAPHPRRAGKIAGLRRAAGNFDALGVAVALLLVFVVMSLTTDTFLRSTNLLQSARRASEYGILAVGMVFVLAMGEVDLSVGAVLTLVNVLAAVLMRDGTPVPLAVVAGVAAGAACGAANGLLSVALRVPAIIVTLGTMGVYAGLATVLSKSTPVSQVPADHPFFTRVGGTVFGVPMGVIVMAALAAFGVLLLHRTPFGWRVQALGSNPQAARFSGIPIARYRVVVMTLMGAVSGLAGVMALAFYASGDPNTGTGYELFAIAAAIIGGTPLSGGSGSVVGAVLGALLMAAISNGLLHLGVPNYWNRSVNGAVIVAAVAVGALVRRGRLGAEQQERT